MCGSCDVSGVVDTGTGGTLQGLCVVLLRCLWDCRYGTGGGLQGLFMFLRWLQDCRYSTGGALQGLCVFLLRWLWGCRYGTGGGSAGYVCVPVMAPGLKIQY